MAISIKKITYTLLFLLLTGLLYKLFPMSQQTATYQISRHQYQDKLYGFWLGQNIGNWTGLITEMDKVVIEQMYGAVDTQSNRWIIPAKAGN